MLDDSKYLLQVEGVTKRFPGVLALTNIDFDLRPGEVHVLLGENGAGKSTLIKILSGAYKNDEGRIFIEGVETTIHNTHHAMNLGIATCYQEFNLIPYLSAAENIFLGRFPMLKSPIPTIDKKKLYKAAQEIIESIGIKLDVKSIVGNLSVAQQQMVEIAKSLSMQAKIYIMDEPTAVLTNKELNELFRVLRKLRSSGAGIIYISHRLEELPVIGDRVTVLRDGQKIATTDIKDASVDQLIEMMVGRSLKEAFPKADVKIGKEVLRVEGLTREKCFHDININVKEGEIVGLAGLVGSKRTEVVRAIFGADHVSKGKVYIDSKEVNIKSPRQGVSYGISYLPEDRKTHGLVLGMSVKDNISLASLKKSSRFFVIKDNYIEKKVRDFIEKLGIKTPSLLQKTKNLSGGNQQKVVIAKWLATGCRIFLFDEPTRGIDVGAKAEVYALMNRIIQAGAAIIMVSSELPEIINMCNRTYVMNNGRICAELNRDEMAQETILKYALMGSTAEMSEAKKEVG